MSPPSPTTASAPDLARWLPYRRSRPGATLRLFCLPYAGGSAAAYRRWGEALPEAVEVCAVQPPGRERRLAEPGFTDMHELADAVLEAVGPLLDRPWALFGHSLGSILAFEIARRAGASDRWPVHLFASGGRAPQRPRRKEPIYHLPDEELIAEIRELGGTPPEVLANDELMHLLLPLLRADFEVIDTYEHRGGGPLPVPISALGGTEDEDVPEEDVAAWEEQTSEEFRLRMLEGGHFFNLDLEPEVLRHVEADLGKYL